MGTLLGGATGLTILVSLLVPARSMTDRVERGPPPIHAVASSVGTEVDDVLRVIETRTISEEHGMLVFGNASRRDSMLVAIEILRHLAVGDIVSDYEGSIER